MDKRETTRLFRLLQALYPKSDKFNEETTMLAWQLVLEPFAYEDIKAAAIERARRYSFPPDPNELCEGLMPEKVTEAKQVSSGLAWQRAIDAGQCRDAAEELGSVSRYAREHGLSWEQAKEAMG